jgi:hypothetical protein
VNVRKAQQETAPHVSILTNATRIPAVPKQLAKMQARDFRVSVKTATLDQDSSVLTLMNVKRDQTIVMSMLFAKITLVVTVAHVKMALLVMDIHAAMSMNVRAKQLAITNPSASIPRAVSNANVWRDTRVTTVNVLTSTNVPLSTFATCVQLV